MGFVRKALYIATFGLSGLVFKENPSPQRSAKPAEKQTRSQTQTKAKATATATRAKSQAARRRKAQTTRASKPAAPAAAANGTIRELERLADMHRRGALSDEEFAIAKSKILGTSLAPKPSATVPKAAPAPFPAVETNIAAARHLADLAATDRGAPMAPITSAITRD